MPLFQKIETVPPEMNHAKVAAALLRLPVDPQQWAPFIYQQALERLPELSEFQLDVVFDHEDLQSSTALGAVMVRRKPAPSLDMMGLPRPPGPQKTASIPVLVLRGKMYPLDLLVTPSANGARKIVPLNSRRLRQAMFRDDIFEGTSQPPGATPIGAALYPSSRDTFYGGNAMVSQKQASLLRDLFEEGADRQALLRKVAHVEKFAENAAAAPVLQALLEEPQPKVAEHVRPTTLSITSLGDGTYLYKMANRLSFDPVETIVPRSELVKRASPELLEAIDQSGGVTLGEETGGEIVDPGDPRKVLTEGGFCRVSAEGKEILGIHIPNLIDLTGMKLPISLFTNGSVYALASELYGVHLGGESPRLPTGAPQGRGVWFRSGKDGVEATVPMEIMATTNAMGAEAFMVNTDDGSRGMVKVQEGVRHPFTMDNTLVLPADFSFMPLPGEPVALDGAEPPTPKLANLRLVHHDHDLFTLEGAPVGGSSYGDTLDTSFKMAALGFPVETTKIAMVAAAHRKTVDLYTPHALQSPAAYQKQAQDRELQVRATFPVTPVDAVKLAADIGDAETIDALLSLSLLGPDTVQSFATHAPELERSLGLLCEMLLASRLGLRGIDEGATEKGVMGLEAAIESCYRFRFQRSGDVLT